MSLYASSAMRCGRESDIHLHLWFVIDKNMVPKFNFGDLVFVGLRSLPFNLSLNRLNPLTKRPNKDAPTKEKDLSIWWVGQMPKILLTKHLNFFSRNMTWKFGRLYGYICWHPIMGTKVGSPFHHGYDTCLIIVA